MLDLTAERQHLAKIVHDYACQFSLTEHGDAQLLQGCYDYMEAFKRVMTVHQKFKWTTSACNILDIFALRNGWSDWLRGLLMVLLRPRKITKKHRPEISAVPA